jgi:putative chitinase
LVVVAGCRPVTTVNKVVEPGAAVLTWWGAVLGTMISRNRRIIIRFLLNCAAVVGFSLLDGVPSAAFCARILFQLRYFQTAALRSTAALPANAHDRHNVSILPDRLATVGFLTGVIRHSTVWARWALIAAALAGWSRRRSRNSRQHVQQLDVAVKSASATAIALADTEDSTALSPQRLWTSALVAVVAGVAIMPLLVAPSRPTTPPTPPTPKHANVNAAITFTAARPNTLDTSLITPGAPHLSRYDAEKWMPSINRAMHDANITTPDQQAAFVAQIDEESGELAMVNELPWGLPRAQWNDEQAARDYFNNKYAYLNGNGGLGSDDGYNYRGRGILQITGKSNYLAVSRELYGDDRLVKDPNLLSQPDIAGAAVAAYWNENNLNRFIPPGQPVTPQQFQDLGSTINTGHPGDVPNNAAERVKYWELTKAALGIK